jgi:hypothetical protein
MQVMDCRRTQVAYCVFVFLNKVLVQTQNTGVSHDTNTHIQNL